ncbi:nuclear transport factor 2 family protein [Flagellimonas sp. 2504JD4-2]
MTDYIYPIKKLSQHFIYALFFLVSCSGLSQSPNKQEDTDHPPYIFNSDNLKQHSKNLSEIYNQMAKYYEGVEKANLDLLDEVFHKNWFMRDTDTPEEATLNIENKQKFIKRVRDHGPYPGYAKHRAFTTIGFANDNLAFVRINKKSSTSFFLYKLNGEWMLMDKLWATMEPSSSGQRGSSNFSEVDELMTNYFKAVSREDQEALDKMLHPNWDKKVITIENKIEIIRKSDFLENIGTASKNADHTKLLSTDLYHQKLAIVRVDFPEDFTTSFLICFKINGQWTIAGERTTIKKATVS